jgi:hypothetical protein
MPDGDIVHPRLSYGYQKIYKQICEGFFDSETLAHYVLPPAIKRYSKVWKWANQFTPEGFRDGECKIKYERAFPLDEGEHLRAMIDHVEDLRQVLDTDNSWQSLSNKFTILTDIADRLARQHRVPLVEIEEKILQLYKCYVQEWNEDVLELLGRGLLEEKKISILTT